jgi:hypothetical protein
MFTYACLNAGNQVTVRRVVYRLLYNPLSLFVHTPYEITYKDRYDIIYVPLLLLVT